MRLLIIFLFIVCVSLGGAFGYVAIKGSKVAEDLGALTAQINELRFSDQYLERRLSSAELENAETAGHIEDLQLASVRHQRDLESLGGAAERAWRLRDTEHLLQLANQRLNLRGDKTGAIRLLESADDNLRQLASSLLLDTRSALAEDLRVLRAAEAPDSEGVYLQLSKLIKALPDFAIKTPHGIAATLRDDEAKRQNESQQLQRSAGTTFGWLKERLGNFASLVVIRRKSDPTEPLLSPEQAGFLSQNMRFMLEQAQAAALRGQEAAYRDALDKAGGWLARYYLNDRQVDAALEQLTMLREQNVRMPQIKINRALNALRAVQWGKTNASGERLSARGEE